MIKLFDDKEFYYKNPKVCPICNNIIDFNKRFNKCCSRKCAVILSNTGRKHSLETKAKISETLSNKKPKRDKLCKVCGLPKDNINHKYCRHQLVNSLVKFGLNKKFYGTPKILEEIKRIKNILEIHYNKYSSNENKLKENLNYYGGCANFHKILKSLNIIVKSNKDANIESYLNGRKCPIIKSKYKHGYHLTWYNKNVYLRSSYELDYAKQLDKEKIYYEVENLRIKYFDTIKNKHRCAIPDFYLPNTNTIVEIKSNWTLNKKNIIDKYKAYKELGYNFKLILEHKEININKLNNIK